MDRDRSIIVVVLAVAILSELYILSKEGYISKLFPAPLLEQPQINTTDTPSMSPEMNASDPKQGENEILAIYEMKDKVIFLAKEHTTASMFSWINPKLKTEHYLAYNTLFTSSDHGETITEGIGYQIRLDNETTPTYSDTYHFEGNRAVINYSPCPYERYIKGYCDLETDGTTADDEKIQRQGHDRQRQDDLIEIAEAINAYRDDKMLYPMELSGLKHYLNDGIPTDPQTGKDYFYMPGSQLTAYELCVPADYFEEEPMAGNDLCIKGSLR